MHAWCSVIVSWSHLKPASRSWRSSCAPQMTRSHVLDLKFTTGTVECNKCSTRTLRYVCLFSFSYLLSCFSHFSWIHFFSQFPEHPEYEFGNERVPYQAAYRTDAERNAAVSRDKRAQRAVWNTHLRLLEVKKSVLVKKKSELERSLWAEFYKLNKEQSDLGAGYADYQFPHLGLVSCAKICACSLLTSTSTVVFFLFVSYCLLTGVLCSKN